MTDEFSENREKHFHKKHRTRSINTGALFSPLSSSLLIQYFFLSSRAKIIGTSKNALLELER